jgi:hypothetical protein
MMVIFNHINLHITFYGHGYGPEMSSELHGRMKLGTIEYRIEVPSKVQPRTKPLSLTGSVSLCS